IKLSKEKIVLAKDKIKFLGHTVENGTLSVLDKNVKAIKNFNSPTDKRGVQALLGLIGYYRKFVPHYSELTLPLTNLLEKDVEFEWNDKCEEAFRAIQSYLMTAPVLRLPDFNKPFVVTTD